MSRLAAVTLLALVPALASAQTGRAVIAPTQNKTIVRLVLSPFGDSLRALSGFQVFDRSESAGDEKLAAIVTREQPRIIQYIRHPRDLGMRIELDDLLAHEIGHVAFADSEEHKQAPEFVADVVATTLGRRPTFAHQRYVYGADTAGVRLRVEQIVRSRLNSAQ